jgi:dihydrolipoamide dehydrogenase
MEKKYDIAIIGSGPGGYVAAIKSAQLGQKVAIIEKEDVGGVCLNWGCIPTKTLLRSAEIVDLVKKSSDFGIEISDYKLDLSKIIQRSKNIALKLSNGVKYLLSKNKVDLITGSAKFIDKKQSIIDHLNIIDKNYFLANDTITIFQLYKLYIQYNDKLNYVVSKKYFNAFILEYIPDDYLDGNNISTKFWTK